jgi:drug/metabolite transporter (DMT)-like permease
MYLAGAITLTTTESLEVFGTLAIFLVIIGAILYLFTSNFLKTHRNKSERSIAVILPAVTVGLFLMWMYASIILDRDHTKGWSMFFGKLFWVAFLASLVGAILLRLKIVKHKK